MSAILEASHPNINRRSYTCYRAALVYGNVIVAAGAAGALTLFRKIDAALHSVRADDLISIDTNTKPIPGDTKMHGSVFSQSLMSTSLS
jgi:hypothetical protein